MRRRDVASYTAVVPARASLGRDHGSVTPRRDNRVQPVVAEHVRDEIRRAENFRERFVADAQAPGVGAEGRHHGALAVSGKAAPLGGAAAGGDAGFGMQVAGDLAVGARRLVAERDLRRCRLRSRSRRRCRTAARGS